MVSEPRQITRFDTAPSHAAPRRIQRAECRFMNLKQCNGVGPSCERIAASRSLLRFELPRFFSICNERTMLGREQHSLRRSPQTSKPFHPLSPEERARASRTTALPALQEQSHLLPPDSARTTIRLTPFYSIPFHEELRTARSPSTKSKRTSISAIEFICSPGCSIPLRNATVAVRHFPLLHIDLPDLVELLVRSCAIEAISCPARRLPPSSRSDSY